MPKMPSNIEKSAFLDRQYVGYGVGGVWVIKGESGFWDAYQRNSKAYLRAETLAELGRKIANYKG